MLVEFPELRHVHARLTGTDGPRGGLDGKVAHMRQVSRVQQVRTCPEATSESDPLHFLHFLQWVGDPSKWRQVATCGVSRAGGVSPMYPEG